MSFPRLVSAALAAVLLQIGAAIAADPLVVVHGSALTNGESTLNFRNEQPAACSTANVGDCGTCSVSCATGQSASCKPGKVSVAIGDGSCQRAPVCRCDSATVVPATKP